MNKLFIGVLCFVMSLAVLNGANALKCYECALCTEPFSNGASVTQKTCNTGESCYKASASALGISTVSKGCMPGCTSTGGSTLGASASNQCCTTDLCNSSQNTRFTYSMMIFTVIAALFYKYF